MAQAKITSVKEARKMQRAKTKEPMSKKKEILIKIGIVVAIIIAIIIGLYFYGRYTMTHWGYSSSDEVVTRYIKAVADPDKGTIENCLCPYVSDYSQTVENQYLLAKNYVDQLTIDADNISITSEPYTEIEQIKSELNLPIDEANLCKASFPVVKTIGEQKHNLTCHYTIITIRLNDKWFIVKLDDTATKEVAKMDESTFEGQTLCWQGDDTIGYIAIPSTWELAETTNDEQVKASVSFMPTTKPVILNVRLIKPNITVETYINQMRDKLASYSGSSENVAESQIEIDGHPATVMTTLYADMLEGQTYVYLTMIFTSPLHDEYIHELSMTCLKGYEDDSKYLTTFTYTPTGIK